MSAIDVAYECARALVGRPAWVTVAFVGFSGLPMTLHAVDQEMPPRPHPSTPLEFVAAIAAANASMSAEAVAGLSSEVSVSIPPRGNLRLMEGRAEQQTELEAIFTSLKGKNITSLRVADSMITQINSEFAFARLRWEISDSEGGLKNTLMTTYVIRREEAGWRIVAVLEMGPPQAPASDPPR